MKITKNFTLSELTVTNTGLPNVPSCEERENLWALCVHIIQPARDKMGIPITVNSGYRSEQVNKKVKGSKTSQHMKGEAADLTCGTLDLNKKLYDVIKGLGNYDQLIWEYGGL